MFNRKRRVKLKKNKKIKQNNNNNNKNSKNSKKQMKINLGKDKRKEKRRSIRKHIIENELFELSLKIN